MGKAKKAVTNERRAQRLGTGAGIKPTPPPKRGIPLWVWVVVALVIAAIAAGTAFALTRGGSSSTPSVVEDRLSTETLDPVSEPTWPVNYDNLAGAISALHLPGQSDLVLHWHVHVRIVADGHDVTIPANLAFDQADQVYSPIHTHDETGVVHIEADDPNFKPTLQEFFDVWGVKFTSDQLGGYTDGVKVWVNGKPVDPAQPIDLHQHDAVTVLAGKAPADFKPDTSYKFPAGE